MKLIISLMLITAFLITSCSTMKEGDTEVANQGNETFEESISEDTIAESLFDDPTAVEPKQADASSVEMNSNPVTENNTNPVILETTVASAEEQNYVVGKNETLMIIAFKIYGDYSKWRELKKWNEDKLTNGNMVKDGLVLKYMAPERKFEWRPSGNPYLIKVGDTLGIISKDTYGTPKHWKDIWHNNEPLIKDPNRIFAGFTLYTPILEGRDVAFSK